MSPKILIRRMLFKLAGTKAAKKQCVKWFSTKIYHPMLTLLLCESLYFVWQGNCHEDQNDKNRRLLRISYISKETQLGSAF